MGRKELEAGNDSKGSKIKLRHTKSKRREGSRKRIENYERTRFNNSPMLDSCLSPSKFKLENIDRES